MPTAEILPKTLRAFQQAMPNVHVRSHNWTNKDILDGIRNGRLQLGLIVPPTKASALHDMRYEELFQERFASRSLRSMRLHDAAPFR
jgi:DNA-binding transcriptional LysR family regulator